jgi:hypothetical protein
MELLALGLATCSVASMISLKLWLDMCRAMSSCEVGTWSKTSDWIRDTWTPMSRWTPEHSMHTITPKLVDSHVASEKTHQRNIQFKDNNLFQSP